MKKIAFVMLAAGNSRRFGGNKLLYSVNQLPMYQQILKKLIKTKEKLYDEGILAELTVVTQYEEIARTAESVGAKVLFNPHPDEGISSSIKIGLKGNLETEGCLFTVSDQPWISQETIEKLVKLYLTSGKGIACVAHKNRLGNPCMFSPDYYKMLLALTGENGGKGIVSACRNDTVVLDVEDEKELEDIDVRHPK